MPIMLHSDQLAEPIHRRRRPRRCSSLKKEADATLFLELARRGYDLSRLRDESTTDTAEIIKIG